MAVRTAGLDRTVPPPPGELRGFRFPPFVHRRIPGGPDVYAARMEGVPLASLELVASAGAERDPLEQSGLATLTAAVMDEGTEGSDSMEIAARAERLGGYLYSAADWDSGFIAVALLSRHLAEGIDLLAQIALTPTFPEKEIERLRRQRLTELLRRGSDPSSQADDRLAGVIFGNTPYAHPTLGRETTLPALDRDALVSFYRRCYTIAGSTLIAVGDFDPEELIRTVETALPGRAGEEPPPDPPAIRAVPLDGISVHVVDRPGASQTELRMGHAGVSRTDPDFLALGVLNTLLGGKFTSRINMNLRERNSYTYGASSRFVGRRSPGPFVVDAAVATESVGAAAREVLGELRRIREEPVEPEELSETLSYMIGVYPYTLQTIGDVAKRLELLAVYGFPDDHYASYTARLAAVTRERLLEVARRHLHPDRIGIVAVGPAETLVPQLEGLGPVTVQRREPAAVSSD